MIFNSQFSQNFEEQNSNIQPIERYKILSLNREL